MKQILSSLILLLAVVQLSTGQIKFKNLSLDEAVTQALKENKLIFIDVYASWCRPCKMLDSNVFPDSILGDYFNKNFVCLKINGEETEGRQIMIDYQLSAYPSLLFLNVDKKVVRKVQGYMSAEDLLMQGKYAVDPTTLPYYSALKQFEQNPSRDNHKNLIQALFEDNQPVTDYCQMYLEKYPDLDLNDDVDFIVFYLLDNEPHSKVYQYFLNNIENFELEYSIEKIESTIIHHLDISIEKTNMQIVLDITDILFPVYYELIGQTMSKQELIDILQAYYDEAMME